MATPTTRLVIACHTCEVIGPSLVVGATVTAKALRGRPAALAIEARAAWNLFMNGAVHQDDLGELVTRGHAAHDLRFLPETYDRTIPIDGWMPRPEHGPAANGGRREAQLVACPDCRAIYRNGDPRRRAVAFLTADAGTKWFLFCRQCRNVWGDAAVERVTRAELTRGDPDLWELQRQGIQDDAATRWTPDPNPG